MRKMGGKKGFTLIELSLAVGFIALLSLTITLIINDTVETYRRGITLNQITTVGTDLAEDMKSAIENSPARHPASYECIMFSGDFNELNASTAASACANDDASSFVYLEREADVDLSERGIALDDVPVYGAICTGAFTYIWNSGYFFGENAGKTVANSDISVDAITEVNPVTIDDIFGGMAIANSDKFKDNKNFRLLKIKDEQRGVCKSIIRNYAIDRSDSFSNGKLNRYHQPHEYTGDLLPKHFNVNADGSDSRKVNYFKNLSEGDVEVVLADNATNPLALYDLTISMPATTSSGEAAFYSSSFILGTLTGGINVKAKGNFCKTPEDYDEDFDYCAINKFNFAAQATGG